MLTLATTTPGEPEIFASLQGEGLSAGKPCAFVRLSRCNLACVWCDTAYTWRFTGDNRPHRDGSDFERAQNQIVLDEADVAARIAALDQPRLVITGGEPLLQAAALVRMIDALESLRPMAIEIETNGTVAPPPAMIARTGHFTVIPKLAHSGNPADLALRAEALAALVGSGKAMFKFVVATPDDALEAVTLAERLAVPRDRLWLMAEGRDSAKIRERSKWLAEFCSENGLNFSDRLHIHLYGDTRGT